MTGLEKIVHEIQAEAQSEADAILAAAHAQAADIAKAAKAESDATVAHIQQVNKKELQEAQRSLTSALALQRRQRILQTKQGILAQTLEDALQALYVLPPQDYFALLVRLAAKHALPGRGEMLLNEKDAARLPADFDKKLEEALPDGCCLSVAPQTRPIDGGFVLKYGEIEQNCSFKDIFAANNEKYADMIRAVLFAE